MSESYTGTYTFISEGPELNELVMMLQGVSPLVRLTNMEARTVFELLLQRGFKIAKVDR